MRFLRAHIEIYSQMVTANFKPWIVSQNHEKNPDAKKLKRYTYYYNLQFQNNVIIIKTKVYIPHTNATLVNFGHVA